MKKAIFLLIFSFLLGGFTYWRLNQKGADSIEYSLPSPHLEEGEQLFLKNIRVEDAWGWMLQTENQILNIMRIREERQTHPTQNVKQNSNDKWELKATRFKPRPQEVSFYAEPREALANVRNFLSLAFVKEDLTDNSSLKALSLELSQSSIETLGFPHLKNIGEVPAYGLMVKFPTNSPSKNNKAPNTDFVYKTLVFLEGTPSPPFKKLYFQGKAYWVREWYVKALLREPGNLYKKDFLKLSAHTLEQVIKTLPNKKPDFILQLTAPYTWSLVDKKSYPTTTISTSITSPFQTVSTAEEKVNAFIETLLFLKAEKAFVLQTPEERKTIIKNAQIHHTFKFIYNTPQMLQTPSSTTLHLYYYPHNIYAETHPTEPLYKLSSQKSYSTLHYNYDDFLTAPTP